MGFENINIITDATGASAKTARQDRLPSGGIQASEQMAKTDLERVKRYKDMIQRVGRDLKIDPALIAGIISRESRAGNVLKNGWGDHDRAWGLMQVDVSPTGGNHTKKGDWNSEEHLRQATGILQYFIDRIGKKFKDWTEAQQLKGAIAAYNTGDGRVDSYSKVDENTTGKDYSNDVVARARWYKIHLFN
uniref:Lysozyme g n=1 Tax=Neogobius melanostomus TaxID=47308 RepID=A0A8C6WHD4_9GOBI